jgi:hypothetical protein
MKTVARGTALAIFALSTTACPGQTATHSLSASFTLYPSAGITFTGKTDATLGHALPANAHAHLQSVTLECDAGEFSWLKSIQATSTQSGQEPTVLFRKTGFASLTSPVDLDIVYEGDVRPFLVDDQKIHIDWYGVYAPSIAKSYPNGVAVKATFTVELQ